MSKKAKSTAYADAIKPNAGLPVPVIENWEWQEQGNCHGIEDPEIFFLPYGIRATKKKEAEDKAKAICEGCPVIQQCLQFALDTRETYGVWGGTTPEERQEMLDKQRNNLDVAN